MTRLLALAALLPAGVARADDLAELLNRVPGDMNTVAVINVREINKTPRAVKEKWRDNDETEYLAGAIAVPPWVTVVVDRGRPAPRGPGPRPVGRARSPWTRRSTRRPWPGGRTAWSRRWTI